MRCQNDGGPAAGNDEPQHGQRPRPVGPAVDAARLQGQTDNGFGASVNASVQRTQACPARGHAPRSRRTVEGPGAVLTCASGGLRRGPAASAVLAHGPWPHPPSALGRTARVGLALRPHHGQRCRRERRDRLTRSGASHHPAVAGHAEFGSHAHMSRHGSSRSRQVASASRGEPLPWREPPRSEVSISLALSAPERWSAASSRTERRRARRTVADPAPASPGPEAPRSGSWSSPSTRARSRRDGACATAA